MKEKKIWEKELIRIILFFNNEKKDGKIVQHRLFLFIPLVIMGNFTGYDVYYKGAISKYFYKKKMFKSYLLDILRV